MMSLCMVPRCSETASTHLVLDAVRISTCEEHVDRLDVITGRMKAIGARPSLTVIEVNEFDGDDRASELLDIA